jgi:hypothetical protein
MRRWLAVCAMMLLMSTYLVGCGGETTGPNVGPAADPRSPQEKESEELLLKSKQK